MRNTTETDRRRSRSSDSVEQQGGGSKATKKSGGLEPRSGPCEVHKLPKEEGGDTLYTLTGAGKRCNCKLDVEDYVVTVHGWTCSEDVRLCPKHFVQLHKRGDVVRVETIEECDNRLRQEEAAEAQPEQQSARAPARASPQGSARSTASTCSLSYAGVAAADTVEEWDARGYPARGVDRVGTPYGAARQLVGGAEAEGVAAKDQCGRFASLMCSAQLCCDTLGMKVEGTHDVFWLAKCTGWSLVSTPEAPVLEMYVVTCGRAVSVSVDSVSNRTGAWQLQWIDDSLVGNARSAMPQFDGCDAAGTPWNELRGGSEWGELVVSPLDMEAKYQQRSMPAVGVARGVGVGPGQGLTGATVPRAPLSAVQRMEQRVTEQSPPSVGSPEWSRGTAQVEQQQRERAKDNAALEEAVASPGRSSSSSSNSNSSGSYAGSSSSSSGGEVMRGRVESKNTRQKAAARRATAAEGSSGASGGVGSGASGGLDGRGSVEDVSHQLRQAGTPGGLAGEVKVSPLVGAAQAVAARGSPGWEDSSVIEGRLKTHQAAPGEGESVFLKLNVPSQSEQSVDLQTVDRLHVHEAVGDGGGALNVHSKGLNSTVGLSSQGVVPAVVLQPSRNDIHKSGQLLAVEAESATVSSAHTHAETPVSAAVPGFDRCGVKTSLLDKGQPNTAQLCMSQTLKKTIGKDGHISI